MIRDIDHIGIAVDALEKALPFWAEALGLSVEGIETVSTEKVKVAFLPTEAGRIELLEATAPDSPIAKHLEKRGPGIHHMTLRVDDIDGLVDRLREKGVVVLGDGVRPGAEDSRVAFLHPKSTGGVLLELVEPNKKPESKSKTASGGDTAFGPGSPVLLYMRDPQEKLWGVLRRLDQAGIILDGIDLNSFDDWLAQIERGEDSVVGPSTLFVPMRRVERILLDRSSGHLPSLAERFERRIGKPVVEVLGADDPF